MLELLGKKMFSNITPYKRTYISMEMQRGENKIIYTLPSTNTSVFFLNRDDLIYIDSIDEMDKLCYIDYDLINKKDKANIKYYEDFIQFKILVKEYIATYGYLSMRVQNKVIFSSVLHIVCELVDQREEELPKVEDSNKKDESTNYEKYYPTESRTIPLVLNK